MCVGIQVRYTYMSFSVGSIGLHEQASRGKNIPATWVMLPSTILQREVRASEGKWLAHWGKVYGKRAWSI